MSFLSGIIGGVASIIAGNQKRNDAKRAMKKSNPFAKYRKFYGEELKSMWQDPSEIFKNPAFLEAQDFGLNSVKRAMAASGYMDSGNMATSLLDYSMKFGLDWLDNQQKFLAHLAGAQFTPNYYPGMVQQGQGMDDIAGGIGAIAGAFGGGAGAIGSAGGGSTGTFSGVPLGGSGGIGTGYGSSPFGQGSWDVINAEAHRALLSRGGV